MEKEHQIKMENVFYYVASRWYWCFCGNVCRNVVEINFEEDVAAEMQDKTKAWSLLMQGKDKGKTPWETRQGSWGIGMKK